MENFSIKTLKFGTEEDFRKALTELLYLKETSGKLSREDFSQVANKYHFPTQFLREGLRGLTFPDDYMISKSKWFPILYRWRIHGEKSVQKLMILITRYNRAVVLSMVIAFLILGASLEFALYLHVVVGETTLQIISWLILPTVFLIVELIYGFYIKVGEEKRKLNEHIEVMRSEKMGSAVNSTLEFVNKHYSLVFFAGHILASKPLISLFNLGAIKEKKHKELKVGTKQKILTKLRLLPEPKPVPLTETEIVPVFYAENPHLDYQKRLSDMFKKEKTTSKEHEKLGEK